MPCPCLHAADGPQFIQDSTAGRTGRPWFPAAWRKCSSGHSIVLLAGRVSACRAMVNWLYILRICVFLQFPDTGSKLEPKPRKWEAGSGSGVHFPAWMPPETDGHFRMFPAAGHCFLKKRKKNSFRAYAQFPHSERRRHLSPGNFNGSGTETRTRRGLSEPVLHPFPPRARMVPARCLFRAPFFRRQDAGKVPPAGSSANPGFAYSP